MTNRIGYNDYKGTGVAWDGLAAEDYQVVSITVDGRTRDGGNINTDDLRQGYALEMDSTTGKYSEFTSDETSLVVLAEPLFDLADYGDQVALAFTRATFKKGKVIEPNAVTWTDAQRFIIKPDY